MSLLSHFQKKTSQESLSSDESLLVLMAQEDPEALNVFYQRHGSKVLSYLIKQGLSIERAEDVLQIVFMQLYRKRQQYDLKHPALAWLFVITKSELRDYKAREKITKPIFKEHDDLVDSFLQQPVFQEALEHHHDAYVYLYKKGLTKREQEVLTRRYLEEEDFEEIAKDLGIKNNHIRQIASRALKRLREAI